MKKQTTITLEDGLTAKAKESGINISQIAEEALERELVMFTQKNYTKGIEAQLSAIKSFLLDLGLLNDFESWKFSTREEREVIKKDVLARFRGNISDTPQGQAPTV